MSLDIDFIARKNIICPHCGEVVATTDVDSVDSGGRGWYPILKSIGYYVPHDSLTAENDWYGKDMVLTKEEVNQVYYFIKTHPDLLCGQEIRKLIAMAEFENYSVVVNANW